jgi:hypothetical protein
VPLIDLARIVVFALGAALVLRTVLSAVLTFVLPRSSRDVITRAVFQAIAQLFRVGLWRARSYEAVDHAMALYAPISLITLPLVLLFLVLVGYAAMFWAVGVDDPAAALAESGSSIVTLGFVPASGLKQTALSISEAAIGLILVALLIAYLPTMYTAFSRREAAVNLLEVRAGTPPSATEMIERFHRIHGLDQIGELWTTWEAWFADVEETHTSLAALVFFRSPQADHSWITAAGAVLDAASLAASTVDIPRNPRADLCIRAGYLALRRIADFFSVPHDPNPRPTDPISISRAEYDEAVEHMAAGAVPIREDREQAWRDFSGWRVNYDTVLLALAELTLAPYAPWSSDRGSTRSRSRSGVLRPGQEK